MKHILCLIMAVVMMLTSLPMHVEAVDSKLIAITYDDGPHEAYTEELLDGLKERGVYVTFFVIGDKVEKRTQIVQRAYDEGHEIANHTWDHPHLTALSADEIIDQLGNTQDILDQICGEGTEYLMRPPFGDINEAVADVIWMPSICWSIDSSDWATNYDYVYNFIISTARDGAIILCHDTVKDTPAATLKAIDDLMAQGYEFVTVSELFRRRGVELEAGETYNSCSQAQCADPGRVKAPVVKCEEEAGGYRITITSPSGAPVYYTTDGSSFNYDSTEYSKPFLVTEPGLIRTVAAFNLNGGRSEETVLYYSENGNLFADVYPDDWYAQIMDELVTDGLLLGTGNCRYEPNTALTRAMLVELLYRSDGQTNAEAWIKTNPFTDVANNQWYAQSVEWAYSNDIVEGYPDGTFCPDKAITRQEMAEVISGFLTYRGNALEAGEDCRQQFYDGDQISDWALNSMNAVVAAGLMQGDAGRNLNPLSSATRAEFGTVLLRLRGLEEGETDPTEPEGEPEPTEPGDEAESSQEQEAS